MLSAGTTISPSGSPSSSEPDLDETQRLAVDMVLAKRFCVITGGPGTGKTRTLKTVVKRLIEQNLEVSIVGPTAKSCAMISKSLGADVKVRPYTIHKVINDSKKINRMRNTCLIIDECSMVSLDLLFSLLFELWNSLYLEIHRLILVGDADQFDPVKGARLFRDLLNWSVVPRVVFERSYRFRDDEALGKNIQRLRCDVSIDPTTFEQDDSFVYENAARDDAWFVERIKKFFESISQYTPNVQVLCLTSAMRKKLNDALQTTLNSESPPFAFGAAIRVNDPVVCVRNYYQGDDLIVNNGASGFARMEGGRKCVVYETIDETGNAKTFKDYETRKRFATRFSLDYARTVHSAQGDEYDAVICALDFHNFPSVDRSAPYTAITRAKQKCVVFANREMFVNVTSRRPVVETELLAHLKTIKPLDLVERASCDLPNDDLVNDE